MGWSVRVSYLSSSDPLILSQNVQLFKVGRCLPHYGLLYVPQGGDSHMKGAGILVGNFEGIKPQKRPIEAWPNLFFKTQTNYETSDIYWFTDGKDIIIEYFYHTLF